jgi:hypothetical protein
VTDDEREPTFKDELRKVGWWAAVAFCLALAGLALYGLIAR